MRIVSSVILCLLLTWSTAHAVDRVIIQDKSVSGRTATVTAGNALTITGSVTQGTSPWVSQEQALTTIYNGHKTIAAAGTQAAIAASTTVKSVSVKALSTNTGLVYVGNASVDSTNGYELSAGEAIDLDVNNLATVYVDVSVNGEGVSYIAGN